MKIKTDNLNWIDILKGVGIVSVVAGHIFTGMVSDFIYMFHMPLFFFISGFLYKVPTDSVQFLKKKAYSLLVPYSVFLIILYSPILINSTVNQDNVIESATNLVFGGDKLVGFTGVFWFITCLFLTQQLFTLLVKRDWNCHIVMPMFLFLSYVNQYLFESLSFPWAANVVFASLPIFYVGYLYKSVTNEHTFVSVIFCLLGSILLYYGHDAYYDMKYANYGIPVVSFVVAIAFSLLIVKLSKKMEESNVLRFLFGNLGKASLIIMFLHQPVQITMDLLLGVDDQSVRFLFAILLPFLAYMLFKQHWLTQVYLLGERGAYLHKRQQCSR